MNKEEIALKIIDIWSRQLSKPDYINTFIQNYKKCLEELNYIEELQQENKQLKEEIIKYINIVEEIKSNYTGLCNADFNEKNILTFIKSIEEILGDSK